MTKPEQVHRMPKAEWWEKATRADLALLGRALRGGWITAADRPVVFAAIRRQAARKGGRFARTVERLLAEFATGEQQEDCCNA
jgi:hypothetical protein